MDIKKYSMKTMCAALACTTLLSGVLAAHAANAAIYETPMDEAAGTGGSSWMLEENSFEDITVTYKQPSSYSVTIPKTIALGTNKQAAYSVKVSGEIDPKQRVYVAPVDGIPDTGNIDFYMEEKDGKKGHVAAAVTHNKAYWAPEEVADGYEETGNLISAPDLTAGTWEGTFQMEVRLEADNSHTHNFADGVCTGCGGIDPDHSHNYVDEKCTICGKEYDPYGTAPTAAYGNWNYTLDDTNNIITLNYYTGSEADVIVYANYIINGKTYKAQLASNVFGPPSSTPYMFNGDAQANCKNIQSITFSKDIGTGNVTDMNHMLSV